MTLTRSLILIQVETRIIGGYESWAHSWPWQVSLQFVNMPACGGAIISPQWVVSAAHCFKRCSVPAQPQCLGESAAAVTSESSIMIGVSMIISHRGYNTRTKENDVSLLKLQKPLVFNQFIRPIDIWMSPLSPSRKCTITGWGSTQESELRLQEVNVTILPPEVCNQYYLGRMRPSMFCAGRDRGGVDACQGDSGGPLACFTGSRFELAGLVSWGIGCGRARRPGVYTKLQQNVEWISPVASYLTLQD
uniref:Peptidase S1 domain-containing protein n=1 Tax=Mola mola TaxID=94237 RepID=A0A3Q3WFM1_MOLML